MRVQKHVLELGLITLRGGGGSPLLSDPGSPFAFEKTFPNSVRVFSRGICCQQAFTEENRANLRGRGINWEWRPSLPTFRASFPEMMFRHTQKGCLFPRASQAFRLRVTCRPF